MGLTHVTVRVKATLTSKKAYEADFLVDTGSSHCLAPARELRKIGIVPVGKTTYELAEGTPRELEFGVGVIEFMGDITGGRIIFGPDDVEPLLGAVVLESVGIVVDPKTQTLTRLPAIPLKPLHSLCSDGRHFR